MGRLKLRISLLFFLCFGFAEGAGPKKDYRLMMMQFYNVGNDCAVHRLMFNATSRETITRFRQLDLVFSNDGGQVHENIGAKQCSHGRQGLIVQYYGQFVSALTRLNNGGLMIVRRHFDYFGNVKGAEKPFRSVDRVTLVGEEMKAHVIVGSCFLDLESIIVCPLKMKGEPKVMFKRLLIDRIPDQGGVRSDSNITSNSRLLDSQIGPEELMATSRFQQDTTTGKLFQIFGRPGNLAFKNMIYERDFYRLGAVVGSRLVQTNDKDIISMVSFQDYSYVFTAEKSQQQVKAGKAFRALDSDMTISTDVGLGPKTGNPKDFAQLYNSQSQEPSYDGQVTNTTHMVVFADRSYTQSWGHSRNNTLRYTNYEVCNKYYGDRTGCLAEIKSLGVMTIIAIVLVVIITLLFVMVVCFLIMFTIFCVKERRKRRHRRKHRKHKKPKNAAAPVAGGAPGAPAPAEEGMDVELDGKGGGAAGAIIDDGFAFPEDDDGKGLQGMFAQHMRRLTKMDEDEEGGEGVGTPGMNPIIDGEADQNPPMPGMAQSAEVPNMVQFPGGGGINEFPLYK